MKTFIALLCLFINTQVLSQEFSFKKEFPSLATTFAAGMFEGTAETLQFHYSSFERVFPNAKDQFWNAKVSWKNKYKNYDYNLGPKFFGSTNIFVWTTDGYHLMNLGRNISFGTTIALHPYKKRKFKYFVLDLALHNLVFNLGFTSTYNLVFNTK